MRRSPWPSLTWLTQMVGSVARRVTIAVALSVVVPILLIVPILVIVLVNVVVFPVSFGYGCQRGRSSSENCQTGLQFDFSPRDRKRRVDNRNFCHVVGPWDDPVSWTPEDSSRIVRFFLKLAQPNHESKAQPSGAIFRRRYFGGLDFPNGFSLGKKKTEGHNKKLCDVVVL